MNSNLPIPFSDAAKIGTILLAAMNRYAKSFVSGLILDLYQSRARLNRIVDELLSVNFMAQTSYLSWVKHVAIPLFIGQDRRAIPRSRKLYCARFNR